MPRETIGARVMRRSKHEKMLSEMHDALYTLGGQLMKPPTISGEKLLPATLRSTTPRNPAQAKKFIEKLYDEFKSNEVDDDD